MRWVWPVEFELGWCDSIGIVVPSQGSADRGVVTLCIWEWFTMYILRATTSKKSRGPVFSVHLCNKKWQAALYIWSRWQNAMDPSWREILACHGMKSLINWSMCEFIIGFAWYICIYEYFVSVIFHCQHMIITSNNVLLLAYEYYCKWKIF